MSLKPEQTPETTQKVNKILADIGAYQKAIDDAQNALATAEQELTDVLDKELNG